MRIVRVLCLASVGAEVLSARVAGAQDTREVVLRLHRAGDTVSIRGATVTIDHTIDPGNTDSAGIVRIRAPFVFPLRAAVGYFDAAASCLIAPDIMRTRAAS